jgi:predicted HicB family RNase H-like nuclease
MATKETVSVRVSPDVWKMAKRYALEIDLSIGQLVEAALIHEMRGKGL